MLCSDVRSCSCVHCMCMSVEHVQISHRAQKNQKKKKTQIAEKESEKAKTLLNFTKLFIDNNLYSMAGFLRSILSIELSSVEWRQRRRMLKGESLQIGITSRMWLQIFLHPTTPSIFRTECIFVSIHFGKCILHFHVFSPLLSGEINFNSKIVKQIAFVNCMRWNLWRWIKSSKRKWMKMFAMWEKRERTGNFAPICGFMCATRRTPVVFSAGCSALEWCAKVFFGLDFNELFYILQMWRRLHFVSFCCMYSVSSEIWNVRFFHPPRVLPTFVCYFKLNVSHVKWMNE